MWITFSINIFILEYSTIGLTTKPIIRQLKVSVHDLSLMQHELNGYVKIVVTRLDVITCDS